MILARSTPASPGHGPSSKAARAAVTARSTSAAPASGTCAHACPVYGSMESNVRPERASTHRPPMNMRSGPFAADPP